MRFTVDRDPVPHLILYDKHPNLLELLAKLFNIKRDDAVLNVHVCPVIEHIQRAGDVDFQRCRHILRFLFLLSAQLLIKVLQHRHIFWLGVIQVIPVDHAHTAVDDGFLDRLQAVLAADDQLTQTENKIGFQAQRVFIVRIIEVQVHRVDEVRTGGGDFDDLPMQPLDQRTVLRFGVADDNVIVGDEKDVGDLALGCKGFAAAGCTKNQTIRVFEELSVHHDKIVGKCVQSAVQRLAAVLVKLLRGKRHKDSDGRCREAALNLDLIQPQRQAAHQSLLLPEVQPDKLAVILLRDAGGLEHVVSELWNAVRDVEHKECQQEHSLIARLQLLQQLFCFRAVGGKVAWNNVHVVAAADSLFLFLDLHAVKVGDLALDSLDGGNLIDRLNVHRDDERTFHIQKIRQHPVIQFWREDLQKRNRAALLPDAKVISFGKFKGAWRNEVLNR